MIRKGLLTLPFLILFFASRAQIPALKSNTPIAAKEASLIFKNFDGKYDFVIAFTKESYWWGNRRLYNILAYKQGEWKKLSLSQKQRKNGKWSKPMVVEQEFNQSNGDTIVSFFNRNSFWKLNRDSLNINRKKINDTTVQAFTISDAVNYKFEIVSNNEFLIIESYAPEYLLEKIPEIKCREVFIKCRDFFVSQLKRENN